MVVKKTESYTVTDDYPSYRTRLFVVITTILFIFIVLISCITYFFTINQVMNDFNTTRLLAEKTFVSSVILTEFGVESFDTRYDFLLHERSLLFLQAYQENRKNPAMINLEALKEKISLGAPGDIELHMINKDGIVEYTTYKRDYKQDFSQYPDFFSSLTNIRLGNEFRSDPWIRDFYDSDVYWKYGYMPTDDHDFILELGLIEKNYSHMHQEMISELRRVTSDALDIPGITHAEVYDKAHRKQTIWSDDRKKNLSSITGMFHGDDLDRVLNQTFISKQSSLIDNPDKNQILSIHYINLSTTRSASGSERSYVGIQVFSTDSTERSILLYRTGFILVTIITLVLSLVLAQYLSANISRPIEMMTEDVGFIASSSLTHSVRATGVNETEQLRASINQMVGSINEYIHEIKKRELDLKKELILREKTEISLAKVNKRLTQLSEITRHDILNQITALKIYLEVIPETDDKESVDEYAEKAGQILEKITLLLFFTYDYEKIGQDQPIWHNIGKLLDQSQNEFAGQIIITHTCDKVEILADPLIKKIIYNLIDNTIRHGVNADTIRVSFEEREKYGSLIYQDNGEGIPKINKEKIFVRGFGKGSGLGMAFITEVLESHDFTICENGVEGMGVRFEITIPMDKFRII
ncbi:MAG TPA: HAMP domain-containing sensor histidine kinase [Methanospirillum sp.]|nr:HAMP domain-containing sensor histidine kinase [Methanospirillum sp.]